MVVYVQDFRQEIPELAHGIVCPHRLRIYTRYRQIDSRTVCQVLERAEVAARRSEPEIICTSCTCRPFPLCFGRKGSVAARHLAEFLTESVRLVPTDAHDWLFGLVGRIAGSRMVLPGLPDVSAVVFREKCTELFVRDFGRTHPEPLLYICLKCRRSGRRPVVAHHKATGGNPYQIDMDIRSDTEAASRFAFGCLPGRRRLRVERESLYFDRADRFGRFFYFDCLSGRRSGNTVCFFVFFQPVGIVGDLFLPVYPYSAVFLGQFHTTFHLVLR